MRQDGFDDVPRRARDGRDDSAGFLEQGVKERRFPHVRPSDDRDSDSFPEDAAVPAFPVERFGVFLELGERWGKLFPFRGGDVLLGKIERGLEPCAKQKQPFPKGSYGFRDFPVKRPGG